MAVLGRTYRKALPGEEMTYYPVMDYKSGLLRWPQEIPGYLNPTELPEVVVPDKYIDYIDDKPGSIYYWRSNTDDPINSPNPGSGHKPFDIRGYRGPVIWDGERMRYFPQADPSVYENPYIPTSDELMHVVSPPLEVQNPYTYKTIKRDPKTGEFLISKPIEVKVIEGDSSENIGNDLIAGGAGLGRTITMKTAPVIWEGIKGLGRTALKGLGLLDAESSLGALGGLTGGVEGQLAGQAVGTGINALIGGATAYDGFQQAVEGFNNGNTAQGVKGLAQAGLGLMGIQGGGVGPIISRNTDKMVTVANNVGRTVNRTAGNLGQEVIPIIRQAGRMVSNVARNAGHAIKNNPRATAFTVLPLTYVGADAARVVMDNINGINISENNGNIENVDTLYKSNGQPWIMDNQYIYRVPNPTIGDQIIDVVKEDWPFILPAIGMTTGLLPRVWRTLSKFRRPKVYTNSAGEKVAVPEGNRPAPYEPATEIPGVQMPKRKRVGISYKDAPEQPKVDSYDAFGTPEEQAAAFLKADERLNQWRKQVKAYKEAQKQERKAKQAKADEKYQKDLEEYNQKLAEYNAKLKAEYDEKYKKINDEWNAYEASDEYKKNLQKRPWYKKWDNWTMIGSGVGFGAAGIHRYNKNQDKKSKYQYVLGGRYNNQNADVTTESNNIDDSLRNATDNYIWDSYSPTQTPDSVAVPEALPNTIP